MSDGDSCVSFIRSQTVPLSGNGALLQPNTSQSLYGLAGKVQILTRAKRFQIFLEFNRQKNQETETPMKAWLSTVVVKLKTLNQLRPRLIAGCNSKPNISIDLQHTPRHQTPSLSLCQPNEINPRLPTESLHSNIHQPLSIFEQPTRFTATFHGEVNFKALSFKIFKFKLSTGKIA